MATNTYNIRVEILPFVRLPSKNYNLSVTVNPAEIGEKTLEVPYRFQFNLRPIRVNLSEPIKVTAFEFLNDIISNYIDENRELKTLLNLGEDTQDVVISYRYGPQDTTGTSTLQLKLLRPIPEDADINTPVFISRELAQTVIDKARFRFAPELDDTPYLRPRNEKVQVNNHLGKTLKNVTLKVLALETGSYGKFDQSNNISFEDSIFRRWYSYDFDSSELNIDFTDYNKFVFYGSAAMRLAAFREKLRQVENLNSLISQFSGSVFTGSYDAAGSSFVLEQSANYAKQKEDLIRSFDRYEQYLYFTPSGSNSPYSGSVYDDDYYDYNPTAYWPKSSSGVLYSVTSSIADSWYVTQSAIAQRYDEFNENNLINTVPTHIREDDDNAPYFTFVAMIGHFFDTIKPYADQFSYINSRYIDPDEELSKDLVAEIAESVGFTLPTINSVYNLSDTILGTNALGPRREYTVESYKRLLHNLPYFAKTKGTRASLVSALKTLGITEQLITVRESGIATTSSLNIYDEFTSGLDYDDGDGQFVIIPVSASNRTPYPRMFQFNLTAAKTQNMTVLNGDDLWALNIKTHPSNTNLGRFELTSGSTTILSSSYQNIFGDELLNVAVRTFDGTKDVDMLVSQVERQDIIFSSSNSVSSSFVDLWNQTDNIYLGGSGSIKIGNYDGTIDEFRLWAVNLSSSVILDTAFDPGSHAGNNYDDPSEYLYIELSFDKLDTTLLPAFLRNESPYRLQDGSPSLEVISTTGLTTASFSRYNRTIRQRLPQVGSSQYVTQKVNVAKPPVFKESNITRNNVPVLSRTKSIVKLSEKPVQQGRNKVVVGTSPTQLINQNIIRNIGLTNINRTLGIPTDLYKSLDPTLQKLRKHYQDYYYVTVDFNKYIRILSEINSVIGQMVEYFIPSKATPLKGIIIEPNVLERNKIKKFGRIKFYGSKARRTVNAPGSLTGSRPDYEGTFNLSQRINTRPEQPTVKSGSYSTYKSTINERSNTTFFASSSRLSGTITGSNATSLGKYNTFTSQSDAVNISEPLLFGIYNTYTSQSDAVNISEPILLGKYNVYETQHENWFRQDQIDSGSKKTRISRIDNIETTRGVYKVYNLQHLDWNDYRLTYDQNYVNTLTYSPSSGSFFTQSLRPAKKQAIDLGFNNMNKVGYVVSNLGSRGADPFNRVYPRKLFEYEISSSRAGGRTSLYKPALYDIKPRVDLTDVGSTTFFNSPSGIYYFNNTKFSPVYKNPFNQPWNGTNFVGATTWSYGQSYVKNDVVFQNVTTDDTEIGYLTGSARLGNGKFYVYKTAAPLRVPDSGDAVYTGSIPSYYPPSIDRENWQRIRFKPTQFRSPQRVIFDTFTIADPSLTNFKTTTVSVDRIIDVQSRYLDSYSIGNVGAGDRLAGEIAVQNIALLFALQSNVSNIRIRLYRTIEDREADVLRSSITTPEPDAGVLVDINVSNANETILTNPVVTLIADSIPPRGNLFYTIDNLDPINSKLDIVLLAYYYALEVEPRIPQGYLRKHYKFYRDNSTATRRRTFEGCKNTEDTTIDGLPAIQIFIGEGSDIVVSPTSQNNEIITGGGGTLSVS